MLEPNNASSIARFHRHIAEQKSLLKKTLRTTARPRPCATTWDGCFQRNVLAVLEQAYEEALAHIKTLPFDGAASPVNQGLSVLTKQLNRSR